MKLNTLFYYFGLIRKWYIEIKLNRVGKKERFITGNFEFNGLKIKYSDSLGFKHSFKEIFLDKTYYFQSNKESPVIVDCGSNIGLSIIYFKLMFPNATVIGFEPDPKIFNLLLDNLKTNLKNVKNLQIHNLALLNEEKEISFYCEGSLSGSIYNIKKKSNEVKVKGVRLSEYIKIYEEIDLLKMDIEGAEFDVLMEIELCLPRIKRIIFEYHSLTKETQRLSDVLFLLERNNFKYYIKQANDYLKIPMERMGLENRSFFLQLNIFAIKE